MENDVMVTAADSDAFTQFCWDHVDGNRLVKEWIVAGILAFAAHRQTAFESGRKAGREEGAKGDLIKALETLLAKPNDMLATAYAVSVLKAAKAAPACSTCGGEVVIYREGEPATCPGHCADHDFANEGGEWLCKHCGEHRPDDWSAFEDTSLSGERL